MRDGEQARTDRESFDDEVIQWPGSAVPGEPHATRARPDLDAAGDRDPVRGRAVRANPQRLRPGPVQARRALGERRGRAHQLDRRGPTLHQRVEVGDHTHRRLGIRVDSREPQEQTLHEASVRRGSAPSSPWTVTRGVATTQPRFRRRSGRFLGSEWSKATFRQRRGRKVALPSAFGLQRAAYQPLLPERPGAVREPVEQDRHWEREERPADQDAEREDPRCPPHDPRERAVDGLLAP